MVSSEIKINKKTPLVRITMELFAKNETDYGISGNSHEVEFELHFKKRETKNGTIITISDDKLRQLKGKAENWTTIDECMYN